MSTASAPEQALVAAVVAALDAGRDPKTVPAIAAMMKVTGAVPAITAVCQAAFRVRRAREWVGLDAQSVCDRLLALANERQAADGDNLPLAKYLRLPLHDAEEAGADVSAALVILHAREASEAAEAAAIDAEFEAARRDPVRIAERARREAETESLYQERMAAVARQGEGVDLGFPFGE